MPWLLSGASAQDTRKGRGACYKQLRGARPRRLAVAKGHARLRRGVWRLDSGRASRASEPARDQREAGGAAEPRWRSAHAHGER